MACRSRAEDAAVRRDSNNEYIYTNERVDEAACIRCSSDKSICKNHCVCTQAALIVPIYIYVYTVSLFINFSTTSHFHGERERSVQTKMRNVFIRSHGEKQSCRKHRTTAIIDCHNPACNLGEELSICRLRKYRRSVAFQDC